MRRSSHRFLLGLTALAFSFVDLPKQDEKLPQHRFLGDAIISIAQDDGGRALAHTRLAHIGEAILSLARQKSLSTQGPPPTTVGRTRFFRKNSALIAQGMHEKELPRAEEEAQLGRATGQCGESGPLVPASLPWQPRV
jgi:hypothetical protein